MQRLRRPNLGRSASPDLRFGRRRTRPHVVPVVFLSALLVSSCSATPQSVTDAAFESFVDSVIQDATQTGAEQSQIDLLRKARTEGYVPLSLTMEAINSTFECFDEAGVYHSIQQRGSEDDFTAPTYMYRDDSEEKRRLADDCIQRHSFFVEMAYQAQPRAEAARQARFEQKLPEIIACLQQQGEGIKDDATTDEVLLIVRQPIAVWEEDMLNGTPIPPDCMSNAGIHTY